MPEKKHIMEIEVTTKGLDKLAKALINSFEDVALTPRELEVLNMYFIEGWDLSLIGKRLHLTRERVRQIKEKAIRRLRSKICLNEKRRIDKANTNKQAIASKVTITNSHNSNGYAIEAHIGHRWQFVASVYPIFCVCQDDESGNAHEEPDDIMTRKIAEAFKQALEGGK